VVCFGKKNGCKLPASVCKYLEPQDSYYIGTDIFYSYIVENKLWKLRILQRNDKYYFEKAEELKNAISNGKFSEPIRAQFRRMLNYFGQIPIIVRSSSFLEDGFGNAFAGKYESIFCVNACDPEERLLHLKTRCAGYMQARWTGLLWSTADNGDLIKWTSKWRFGAACQRNEI